jgi:hypothetical protein
MKITLEMWEGLQTTDFSATKKFNRGGGFSGTAINPTWVSKKLTETFGPCGIGWGVSIDDERFVEGSWITDRDRTVVHILLVSLWYIFDGEKRTISHYGQTTFVGSNKYGVYTDEEAPKKSLTDGMTKCASMLGIGADVHLGMWDDNKYVNDRRNDSLNEKVSKATENQVLEIERLITETGSDRDGLMKFFIVDDLGQLTAESAGKAIAMLQKKVKG